MSSEALPGLPRDEDGPVFAEPWEAQAFSIVVALHERGVIEWPEWTERLAAEIERARAAGAIGHVHVADAPGRRVPGSGSLDLPSFLDAIAAAGYDGPIGLEYDAEGDTPGSLAFLRP